VLIDALVDEGGVFGIATAWADVWGFSRRAAVVLAVYALFFRKGIRRGFRQIAGCQVSFVIK
jgi:hypothetical protein